MSRLASPELTDLERRLPILAVLNPRQHCDTVLITGSIGLVSAAFAGVRLDWQLWQSVALVLVVMSVPAWMKWRADAGRFGMVVAVAGALVTVQGLHGIEHLVQWWQRHAMGLPLRASNGLLSPANSEWVHFTWNWLVVVAILYLVLKGMRGLSGWALLAWALAHTLEHTYVFVRFLDVSAQLTDLGVGNVTAQGLPGVFGADGWLDLHGGSLIGGLTFLTTASRLDVHFAWNAGETLLLLAAVHHLLRRLLTEPRVLVRHFGGPQPTE